jgi:hypothetical protein
MVQQYASRLSADLSGEITAIATAAPAFLALVAAAFMIRPSLEVSAATSWASVSHRSRHA